MKGKTNDQAVRDRRSAGTPGRASKPRKPAAERRADRKGQRAPAAHDPEAPGTPGAADVGGAEPKRRSRKAAAGGEKPANDVRGTGRKSRGAGASGGARQDDQQGPQEPVGREAKGTPEDVACWLPHDAREQLLAIAVAKAAMDAADKEHEKRGRPTKKTPKRVQRILSRLAEGTFLTVICKEERLSDPDFPAPSTVHEWEEGDPDFSRAIVRAREAGAHCHLAAGLQIVDTGFTDYIQTPFGIQFNSAAVQRSRLQAEYRQMLAEKLAPRSLGKKVELASNPDRPITGVPSDYTMDQLVAEYEKLKKAREGSK